MTPRAPAVTTRLQESRALRIAGLAWGMSATVHAAALAALVTCSVALVDERASLAGRRSVASLQLLGSVASLEQRSASDDEAELGEVEASLGSIDDSLAADVADSLPPPAASPPLEAGELDLTPLDRPEAPVRWTAPVVSLERRSPLATRESERIASTTPETTGSDKPETAASLASTSASGTASAAATPIGWDDVQPATPLNNPAPHYPPDAAARGLEGRITLRLVIAADGSLASITIVSSSGHAALDNAALDAVRRWRFSPARRGQQPVTWTTLLPVRFRAR